MFGSGWCGRYIYVDGEHIRKIFLMNGKYAKCQANKCMQKRDIGSFDVPFMAVRFCVILAALFMQHGD